MRNTVLSKTIFISLLGHLTLFSIFNLSFSNIILKYDYTSVSFWGQFLYNSQVRPPLPSQDSSYIRDLFIRKPDTSALDKVTQEAASLTRYYLKPPVSLLFNTKKGTFIKKYPPISLPARRREPAIIFHPLLPYDFTLYFKDRQVAHVELMFNIASGPAGNSIFIKRKISSGNLEVDLLVSRYISRYLFIQQANFTANNWQAVKIDLSAKND